MKNNAQSFKSFLSTRPKKLFKWHSIMLNVNPKHETRQTFEGFFFQSIFF